jgi:tetratricopeptide (TPR) repeat protein
MEPRDQDRDDRNPRSNSPEASETPARDGGREAGTRAAAADLPAGTSIPVNISRLRGEPDRTTVIKTSAIREPGEAFDQRMLLVPIESAPSGRAAGADDEVDRDERESRKSSGDHAGQGRKSGKAQADLGRDREGAGGHPMAGSAQASQQPSLMRLLLYTGAVALACGVAGAWAYSYFFGGPKSGDQGASGKSSESGGSSGSGRSSGSGQGSNTGSGPDSGQGADTSQKGPGKGELLEAQKAWLTAVKEIQDCKAAEKEARHSEQEARTILDFLKRTLFSAGRSGDKSLSESFWAGGQGQDMTLHKALDAADRQVAVEFSDRPLVEASIREMLGLGYLNVGEAQRSVEEYKRALTLREATQGPNQPDTAGCRNQLAIAYRLAGKTVEAGKLFDRNPNSPAEADVLAARGLTLLVQKKPEEAELAFRQCLNIRDKLQADDWTAFDARSCLGGALLDQKRYADAEPLLLSGFEGLRQREVSIPTAEKPRLTRALERLVRLYDAWGKQDDAMKWRKELAAAGTLTSRPS